ncbi:hypothetical protein PPACK8108_LOCUS22411 [Phakopsora pachyrhizi]|uniref:Uncharacterized protein n=1 Tax=Phakopsora pachyrhizi TaxID=170000 RepID=A0AAV0BPU1_PHAPC|nr:hypothetical protein PPACK8108_LOCUS22411 [Phakopsora pachyrhizi]
MIFNFPNLFLCLALLTKFTHGYEEAVDFLASFSSQFKTDSRASDVFEPIIQAETLEKDWLSLGTSNSKGETSDKHYEKVTDKNGIFLGTLGKSNDLGSNNFLPGHHVYQNHQPKWYGMPIASTMAANPDIAQSSKPDNVRVNYMYDPNILINHDPQYQSSVNSFKKSKIMDSNKGKAHATKIDIQHNPQNFKEQTLNSEISIISSKKIKKFGPQIVSNTRFKKKTTKKKRKYKKKHQDFLVAKLWNSVLGKKIIITPQQKEKFEGDMMKLLEPENSWVKLDFIQECISSIQKLTQNDMKDSMLANLDYINRQIVKHGGEEFYITDTEARAFFSTPEAIRFKIKSVSKSRLKTQSIRYHFLGNFKVLIEPMSFENLVKKILNFGELKLIPISNPTQWQSFDLKESMDSRKLSKKMYVGKLFLIYSIMINKIFCDGPNDDRFIERQREAIKFYDTVFGASNQDDSENFVFRIDSLPKLAELSDRKDIQEKGISKFNSNLEEVEFVYMNYERTLYANAMFLIETWLSIYRTGLYNQLNKGIRLKTRFRPFLNSIFEILLQLIG